MPAFPAYTRIYVCKSTILYSNTIPAKKKAFRLTFISKKPPSHIPGLRNTRRRFADFYFIEVQIILLRLSLPLLLFLPPTVCLLQEPILLHNVRIYCRDVPMFPGTGGLWNVRRIP